MKAGLSIKISKEFIVKLLNDVSNEFLNRKLGLILTGIIALIKIDETR